MSGVDSLWEMLTQEPELEREREGEKERWYESWFRRHRRGVLLTTGVVGVFCLGFASAVPLGVVRRGDVERAVEESKDSYEQIRVVQQETKSVRDRLEEVEVRESEVASREQLVRAREEGVSGKVFGVGDWMVGTQVLAGRYRLSGGAMADCSWVVYPMDAMTGVLDVHAVKAGETVEVDLKVGQGFGSECGTWERVG